MKGFFRALDCTLPWDVDEIDDAMPVEIDALQEWTVGDRMLADLLRGMELEAATHAEWRRGMLPPGRLGWRKAKDVSDRAAELAIAALQHQRVAPDAHDIDVDLGDGRRVTGTVSPVFGDRTVSVTYSRLAAKHVLQAWIPLVALTAQKPDGQWSALCVGRGRSKNRIAKRLFTSPPDGVAVLRDLVALYDAGRREPLPLPLKTSCAWAEARRDGDDPVEAARDKWESPRFHFGDNTENGTRKGMGPRRTARGAAPPARRARRTAVAARAAGRGGRVVMQPFDLDGPLPAAGSTTVLEASAGTGKTFALATLVARYLAEGVATLDQMLLITFNRAASRELRERVRAKIAETVAAVDDEQRSRLRDALANFDAATIATTHEFCGTVLKSLGVAGDTDTGVTLVESLDDLVGEIVNDLYLAHFGQQEKDPLLSPKDALDLARAVVNDPCADLRPLDPDADTEAGVRRRFADDVLDELDRRKRRMGILGYDDLLGRLAKALEREDSPARDRMQRRWRIVMVDEFQDTDPVQWQVLERAFSGRSTLILIGDPKQAIYAFRGGDIHTYLRAARTAGDQYTLGVNWRSDKVLVDSLQTVMRGAALGHDDIVVHPIEAQRQEHRLAGAPHNQPFRLRVVRRGPGRLRRHQGRPDRRAAQAHRRRPHRRHRRAAGRRGELRRASAAGRGHRDHRRTAPRRAGLPGCVGAGRNCGGVHRGRRRVHVEGGRGLAVPAGGVRPAAPQRAGARRRDDDVLRQDRRRPCGRR